MQFESDSSTLSQLPVISVLNWLYQNIPDNPTSHSEPGRTLYESMKARDKQIYIVLTHKNWIHSL